MWSYLCSREICMSRIYILFNGEGCRLINWKCIEMIKGFFVMLGWVVCVVLLVVK